MTNNEMSVTDEKQIVVPSFGTVGALFARHFDILRNLKRRIMLLKQSHENQHDDQRSWEYVQQILRTLDKACSFLDFDDVHSSRSSRKTTANRDGGDDKGEGKKKFYEDPTLHEDEQKMNEVLEEKRRVEDMLQPGSVDLGSQAAGSASNLQTINNSSQKLPGAGEEIKEMDEGEEEK